MAKIPFNIDYRPQVESGEYKVVTSSGDPVRILAWDLPGDYPIAAAKWEEGDPHSTVVDTYDHDGWDGMGTKQTDLYIVTPEPAISNEERDYLAAELTSFLANYEREFDDDAPLSEVAEHFFFVGKKYEREHPSAGDTEQESLHIRETCKEKGETFMQEKDENELRESKSEDERIRSRDFLNSHSWKPSEGQMGALNYAYCELFKREDVGHNILGPLQELCDDLKKL